MADRTRPGGWGLVVAGVLCLLALGGYAAFLISDRPPPVPARAPASFGLAVIAGPGPMSFRLVDTVSLDIEGLDTATATVELRATFR